MVTLTVVVPATDLPPTLDRCLAAIDRAIDPPTEVITVTTPGLTASAARNLGARQATGDVVVFVDADVEVHEDAFVRVREAFERHPDLTAVHGSYDDRPGVDTTVSAFRNLLHHHVHQEGAGPAETFWTGLGAVRRSAFLAVGGFDEVRYPHPSIEDIELGGRLVDAGGTLLLDPSISGTHLKRWTLRSMVWTDLVRRGIPWVALQVRTQRVAATLNCGWRHRLSALAVAGLLLAAVLGHPLLAVACTGTLLVANRGFYGLLVRRQGWARAAAGVGLHALHHLVALVAVPAGIAAALASTTRADAPALEAIAALDAEAARR